MRIALAGNPNSGKTTMFNALTGANQYVGNWPGVTVEKKEGVLKGDSSTRIIDLPGIYSLSPYSPEEIVARGYLLGERPDVILNIVDGSNIERNLYLTTQLLEVGIPVVVAVNMMDVVRKRGQSINIEALSSELGCFVVEVSALKNEGLDEAIDRARAASSLAAPKPITFSAPVEEALSAVSEKIGSQAPEGLRRFYAIKLLERDEKIAAALPASPNVDKEIDDLERAVQDTAESAIINDRYEFISRIIGRCRAALPGKDALSVSDKIDRVVTNRFLALPIFVVVMFLVYYISISSVGTLFTDWANDGVFGDGWYVGPGQEQLDEVTEEYDAATSAIDAFTAAAAEEGLNPESEGFAAASEGVIAHYESYDDETGENETVMVDAAAYAEAQEVVARYGEEGPDPAAYGFWVPGIPVLATAGLTAIGCADWLQSLIVDGIIAGVGAVLGFVPQLLVLFLLLAFLESCGYMARIAFILDRAFRRFGLSGKSFVPMLIGTGCGVPGIMASRTIESQKDRRMTIMTTTFMPCGAKLPIIALFAAAIFGGVWWVAPSAYFLGIAAILLSGLILKKTRFFAGDPSPFVMELPEYHMPTAGGVLRSMWERAWSFIKKAGTIILLACVLVWFISGYGFVDGALVAVEDQNASLLAALGGSVAWLFAPLGWGDWQAVSATVTGLIAKENVVGTLGVLYDGDAGWYANLQAAYTPLVAYSFMAFNLLCAPCFAAMGAIKREMNNAKWFWAAIGYECGLAYAVSLCLYQLVGLAIGEVAFNLFTVVSIGLVALFLFLLFKPAKKNGLKKSKSQAMASEAA